MEQLVIETPAPQTPPPVKPKQRHGCLTAWLIFIIVACALFIILYLAGSALISETLDLAGWVIPVLIILLLVEIACAIALFMWKKWGFWGFCAIAVFSFIINMALGLGIVTSIGGLVSIAILYGVLNIGKDNKGWPQMD